MGWPTADSVAVPANAGRWLLPARRPEGNPMQQLWGWLRDHQTQDRPFTELDCLVDTHYGVLTDYAWLHALPFPGPGSGPGAVSQLPNGAGASR